MLSLSASAAATLAGDPVKGKEVYVECAGCHDLKENRIGPHHCGVVGRKAGSLADFPGYSQAMKDSGLTWDVATLDNFLKEPFSFVSGTLMGYFGIEDKQARLDVIAYLQQAGGDPALCSKP